MGLQLLLRLSCCPGNKDHLSVGNIPHYADRKSQGKLSPKALVAPNTNGHTLEFSRAGTQVRGDKQVAQWGSWYTHNH